MPKKNLAKYDSFVNASVFRDKDPNNWGIIAHGSGNKNSSNYGMKIKRINREEGLRLKNTYGMDEDRDQYGSYGYKGKLPKSLW